MIDEQLRNKLSEMANRLVPVAGELMRRACGDQNEHSEKCECSTCRAFVTTQDITTKLAELVEKAKKDEEISNAHHKIFDIGYTLLLWNDRRHDWSQKTFGETSQRNHIGPLKHLEKEVKEALAETDRERRLVEYADCLHLIFDAADRDGFDLLSVLTACEEKLKINMAREWPKPDANNLTEAIEHEPGTR